LGGSQASSGFGSDLPICVALRKTYSVSIACNT
jgi:hypothetical protein